MKPPLITSATVVRAFRRGGKNEMTELWYLRILSMIVKTAREFELDWKRPRLRKKL